MRMLWLTAVLTGGFCAVFAMGIDWLTDMLARRQVIALSFASGFLGSVFAQLVLRRGRDE